MVMTSQKDYAKSRAILTRRAHFSLGSSFTSRENFATETHAARS